MEDLCTTITEEHSQLLALVEEQRNLFDQSLLAAFDRLSTKVATAPQSCEGARQLSIMLKPKQPELIHEGVDMAPPPAPTFDLPVHLPERIAFPDAGKDPDKDPVLSSKELPAAQSKSLGPTATVNSLKTGVQKTPAEKLLKNDMSGEFQGVRAKCAKFLPFVDYVAAVLVLLNSLVMMLQLELEGQAIGHSLGAPTLGLGGTLSVEEIRPHFRTVHHIFVFLFLGELLFRLGIFRRKFFRDLTNWFDSVLVIFGLLEITILEGDPKNVLMLRLMRTVKAFRAIRLARTFKLFRGLQLLVKACFCFLPSLGWSMALLAIFMSIGTLVLGNLLQDFMTDPKANLEDQLWIWGRYGTAYRAMYTLFEVTFAGNWPTNVRPVLDKVSHTFVIFFVLYVSVIVFALIRVISAIFLKDTLDAAQADAENLVVDRLRKKAEYVDKLQGAFNAIDEGGNGMISEEQLTAIFANPKVEAYFQTLDVDVSEGRALFHMIDNGDGQVTLDEFIDGILRCRGPARALDQVAMQSDLKNLDGKLSALMEKMTGEKVSRKSQRLIGLANLHAMEAREMAAHHHVSVF